MIRLVLTAAALVVLGPPGPGEILQNSDVARARMLHLRTGLLIYINYHNEQIPAELSLLFPDFVDDPLDFWHPGDFDPAPITIDNSVPNAPNSARISFDWLTQHDYYYGADDTCFVRDNAAANNGGQFVNFITVDGVIETDPPLATPTPTSFTLARAHLRRLYKECQIYTNDNSTYFPDDFIRLWEVGHIQSPRSFWNPGDSQPLPGDITNSVLDGRGSAQISFEYLVAGLSYNHVTPETMFLRDISPTNNAGLGVHIVWGDGRVQFQYAGTLGDWNDDCHIDLRDTAGVQQCFAGMDVPILENACRAFDWDGDDDIELEDVAPFQVAITGPLEVVSGCSP